MPYGDTAPHSAGDAIFGREGGNLRNNAVADTIFGKEVAYQPGVGGPAKDPTKLVQDPSTGLFFDPTTGTTYTDASGATPVTNPNVAQQVARNFAQSQSFLNQLPGLNDQRQQVYGHEEELGKHFQDILSGRTPSLAAMQAHTAFQEIARQQLAQTAGANGASAPLAQLAAARNTGSASVGANNTAAMAKVAEQRDAANAYASLLNNQGMGVQRATDSTLQGGEDFSQLAATGEANQQGMNQRTNEKRADEEGKFGDAALSFLKNTFSPIPGLG